MSKVRTRGKFIPFKRLNTIRDNCVRMFRENRLECDGERFADACDADEIREIFDLLCNNGQKGYFVLKKKVRVMGDADRFYEALSAYRRCVQEEGLEPCYEVEQELSLMLQSSSNFSMDEFTMENVGSYRSNEIVDVLMEMRRNADTNYYITSNMAKNGSIKATNIYSYSDIVMDLDCHESYHGDIEELMFNLKNMLLLNLPCELYPNIAVFTGRGLQLHWTHETCSFKMGGVVRETSQSIAKSIQNILDRNSDYSMVKLDSCIQTNPLHLVRLPFSYNTSAGRYGNAELLHANKANINVLRKSFYREAYGVEAPEYNRAERRAEQKSYEKTLKAFEQVKKTVVKAERKPGNRKGYRNLLNYRRRLLEHVVNKMHYHSGCRNTLLHGYAVVVYQLFDEQTAEEMIWKLNEKFVPSMGSGEVMSILNSIKKNEYYNVASVFQNLKRYKQTTWIEYFSKRVAKFDEYLFEFKAMIQKKEEQKQEEIKERLINKMDRNQWIEQLAKDGCLMKDIAEIVGVCRKTVYNVLRKIGGYFERANRLLCAAPI